MKRIFPIFMEKVRAGKKYYLLYATFFIYLLTIPHLVDLSIPCMRPVPGKAYEMKDCVLSTAYDRYLLLAITGFAAYVGYHFWSMRKKQLKPLLGVAIILAVSIIIFFHLYIPHAEQRIFASPVLLVPTSPLPP